MQRYLVIEFLKKQLRIIKDVLLVQHFIVFVIRSLSSALLLHSGLDDGVIGGQGSQLVVVVVAIELRLD